VSSRLCKKRYGISIESTVRQSRFYFRTFLLTSLPNAVTRSISACRLQVWSVKRAQIYPPSFSWIGCMLTAINNIDNSKSTRLRKIQMSNKDWPWRHSSMNSDLPAALGHPPCSAPPRFSGSSERHDGERSFANALMFGQRSPVFSRHRDHTAIRQVVDKGQERHHLPTHDFDATLDFCMR
jgi:hypothetical protein